MNSPSDSNSHLTQRAIELLDQNYNGSYIVPSSSLYPHMWLWDTCFHAIALVNHNGDRAKEELKQLLSGQWKSGLIPHILFSQAADDHYRPNSKDWGTEEPGSGITQPPICATAVRFVYEVTGDKQFLSECYTPLRQYHTWLKSCRDPDDQGLVAILHPWESGTDNSLIFINSRDRFLSEYPNVEVPPRVDRKNIAAHQRPTDDDYKFYWGLLTLLRASGWDTVEAYRASPFAMWDILFNSIWCRSNYDLSFIAKTLGEAEETEQWQAWHEQTVSTMCAKLWDSSSRFFYAFDIKEQAHTKIKTSSAFISLFATTLPEEIRTSLLNKLDNPEEFASSFGLPSAALSEKLFNPICYWQGPIWLNIHWLVINGLRQNGCLEHAERLQRCSQKLIARSGFREYYDPHSGEGLGASNFSWSTLAVLGDNASS